METIDLEKGWLERQMDEVRREVENWPEVLKPLTSLNSSLVHRHGVEVSIIENEKSEKEDLEDIDKA